MTSISKNVDKLVDKLINQIILMIRQFNVDKLDNIVNEYNNTYHIEIKMKPLDVKNNTYIDSIKEVYDKDAIFKVGDHVRIPKYKIFLLKDTL